jgi:hypothetical protein
MGTQGVSQCFGCGVVGEGKEDIGDGNFYCFACWLIYHTSRARLRQDTAHVQPVRNLQGVSYQLQRTGACTEHCTIQNTSFVFEQHAQRACTQITTQAAHVHDLEAEFTQVGGWDTSSDSDAGHSAVEESDRGDSAVERNDEGDRAVEGSEEHFDESEHVDGFAQEERSTDGEDGYGEEVDESEIEGGRGPEGSDFAAEEGYEEGGPNAEEGYEEVWDEVQEALSKMG